MSTEIEKIYPNALRERRKALEKQIEELQNSSQHPDAQFNAEAIQKASELQNEIYEIDRQLQEMGEHLD